MIRARRTFAALYFLGAASALVLEVVWFRWMALSLGSTVQAAACVLGAFMLGLSSGAWSAARWGDRLGKPLRAYATMQALGGVLALLPWLVHDVLMQTPFAVGMLAVAVAAHPLGWVFPLATRVRREDPTGKGGRPGVLYALDTAGAVAGVLLCGVWLVPVAGLRISLLAASVAKLVVSLVSLGLPLAGQGEHAREEKPVSTRCPAGALWLAGVQGFVLLGAEVLWMRLLAFVLYRGSTTYAFVAMLATVLGGTALGAWLVGRKSRATSEAIRVASACSLLCGLTLLASLALLLVAGPAPGGGLGLADLGITLLACAPASLFSGAVFSASCQAAQGTGPSRGAGSVLAVNTVAAVAGAMSAPLLLVPVAGISVTLAGMGLVPVIAALVVSWRRRGLTPGLLVPAGVALLVAVALPLTGPRWIRHLGEAVFYHEGPDVSVAVIEEENGTRRLFVDGIAVAGTDLIMSTDQKTLAHLPVLLHPGPGSVLTVGFGSGGTSSSLLLHPDLEVHCAEIAEGVVRAAPHLEQANRGFFRVPQPRYRLHLQDARRYLATTERRFDVIVNDCTDLAYKSDASLYTVDFFRLMRARLEPGGLGAAWIPLRGEPPFRVLRSVIASFGAAFDSISLWVFDAFPTHFAILVGGDEPVRPDLRRIQRVLENPAVRADLEPVGLADAYRLATSLHLDDPALRRFSASTDLHTDDRPVVEFWAPLESGDDASAYAFLDEAGPPTPRFPPGRDSREREMLAARGEVRPWLLEGHRAYLEDREAEARLCYLRALRLSPDDAAVRTLLGLAAESRKETPKERLLAVRILEGRVQDALRVLDELPQDDPENMEFLLFRALVWLDRGSCTAARAELQDLLGRRPPAPVATRAAAGLVAASLPEPFCQLFQRLTFAGL